MVIVLFNFDGPAIALYTNTPRLTGSRSLRKPARTVVMPQW
jgi:hypothetical protein